LKVDLDYLQQWVASTEVRIDVATAAPLAGLAATLDQSDPPPVTGTRIPPLAHWLYFLPQSPQHDVGVDGHPKRGGFLPPVPLPRRMWAGGRLHFHHPICIGDELVRRSTITAVEAKQGRSGPLVFVTVRHELSNAGGIALREQQDIVYRNGVEAPGAPPAPSLARTDETFTRRVVPDPVLLFRYSALTFNGHRIHYDRPYATEVEGYPGLVVHGPLIATLLAGLVQRELPDAVLQSFSFKAASPLFDMYPFSVCGTRESDGSVALWARGHHGQLAMQARAELADET
jgi:3-methylfumaryl-CoA hydratase